MNVNKRRRIYRIRWSHTKRQWSATVAKGTRFYFGTQAEAVDWATDRAAVRWSLWQIPGQVVLHAKDGRIKWERTYGFDPRRTKG